MRTIADLMLLTARHLAGRPVIINFGAQVYSGVNGHMQKDLCGRPVVTVSGDLDREEYIRVFLHELAHVKLHFHQMTPTDKRPQKQTYTGAALAAKDKREQEAKALADKWMTYADRRADDLEGRLWALSKYKTT